MGEFVKQGGDFNGRVYYKQKETEVDRKNISSSENSGSVMS